MFGTRNKMTPNGLFNNFKEVTTTITSTIYGSETLVNIMEFIKQKMWNNSLMTKLDDVILKSGIFSSRHAGAAKSHALRNVVRAPLVLTCMCGTKSQHPLLLPHLEHRCCGASSIRHDLSLRMMSRYCAIDQPIWWQPFRREA